MNIPFSAKPLVIFLLGLGFVIYLLSFLNGATFFSGDGGIKYLMVRQFSTGNLSMTLSLPFAAEAAKFWDQGFYPFDVPFVYDFSGKHIMSFPIYFSLLTAPFFALLDWRGLYILPALSLPLLWLWLIYCSRQLHLNAITTSVMLLAIIFCSPLTLYGVMFWEHAPAVFCTSMSLCLLFKDAPSDALHRYMAFGAVTGIGVFFRPEVLVMTLAIIIISLVVFKNSKIKEIASYSLGFFCLVAVFFIINFQIYGSILGLHSDQVTNQGVISLLLVREILYRTIVFIMDTFKICLFNFFILVIAPIALRIHWPFKKELLVCLLAIVVTIPCIAFIVPNAGGTQWGSRYLLVLLPWTVMALGLIVEAIYIAGHKRKQTGTYLLLITMIMLDALCFSFEYNSIFGAHTLQRNYAHRYYPAAKAILNLPEKHIVTVNVTNLLATLVDNKIIMIAPKNEQDFVRAIVFCHQQGVMSLIYVLQKNAPQWIASPQLADLEIGLSVQDIKLLDPDSELGVSVINLSPKTGAKK